MLVDICIMALAIVGPISAVLLVIDLFKILSR